MRNLASRQGVDVEAMEAGEDEKLINPGGAADTPEVVDGELLAAVLQEWRMKYSAERPENHLAPGEKAGVGTKYHFVSALMWLAQETGLHLRTCSGLCSGEWPFVSLSRADKVLTAIGKSYLLGDREDSEIKILRHPRWSQERWFAYMSKRGCV